MRIIENHDEIRTTCHKCKSVFGIVILNKSPLYTYKEGIYGRRNSWRSSN